MLEFTGGEPLLLPGISSLVKKSKELGFFVQLMTNGTFVDENISKELADSEVNLVSVSVDCYDDKRASKYRGVRNINQRIKRSVSEMKREQLLMASTTLITKFNFYDIEKTVEFVNSELGIYFSFCPPDFAENYMLGSNKVSISPSREQLIETFEKMRDLKKSGYRIMNTHAYIKDAIKWFKDEKTKYACMAGKNIIYVDWMMNVYPCFIKKKVCNLAEFSRKQLAKLDCNQCCFLCFREPSIFYHKRGRIEFIHDVKTLLPAVKKSISLIGK
jgi:MoaA/NifB/PqqE/SkfB family radical SAM enzyme